jgi:hypothetical protein
VCFSGFQVEAFGLPQIDPAQWAAIFAAQQQLCDFFGNGSDATLSQETMSYQVDNPDQKSYHVQLYCDDHVNLSFGESDYAFNVSAAQVDLSIASIRVSQNGVDFPFGDSLTLQPGSAKVYVDIGISLRNFMQSTSSSVTLQLGARTYAASFPVEENGIQEAAFDIDILDTDGPIQYWKVEVNPDEKPQEISYLNNTETIQVNLPVTKTSILPTDVRIAQTVYNPVFGTSAPDKRNVVFGKSASFEVDLDVRSANGSGPLTGTVDIQVLSDSRLLAIARGIPANRSRTVTADKFSSFVPDWDGMVPLKVVVDVSRLGPNVTTNPLKKQIDSVKTYTPKIGIIKSGDCLALRSCYGAVTQQNFDTQVSTETFTSDVLPVPDNAIKYTVERELFRGLAVQSEDTLVEDLTTLLVKKHLLGLDKLIAVVPKNYFTFAWNKNPLGATPVGSAHNISLVREDADYATIAHELYHGLGVRYELYASDIVGYNARTKELYNGVKGLMAGGVSLDVPVTIPVWPDDRSYSIVSTTLLSPPPDPSVLLVSGIVSDTGNIKLGASYNMEHGYVSVSDPNGALEIRLLDDKGVLINKVSLSVDTNLLFASSDGNSSGIEDLKQMPFATTFPWTENAFQISFLFNGKVTKQANIASLLLKGIVDAIPLAEFKAPEANGCAKAEKNTAAYCEGLLRAFRLERRAALYSVAEIAERQLDSGQLDRAVVTLNKLIGFVEATTDKTYIVADETELSQTEVIDQINQLKNSIRSKRNSRCKWKKRRS